MKTKVIGTRMIFLLILIMSPVIAHAQYLQYVRPLVGTGRPTGKGGIGGSDFGQTMPAVLVPNGMNFWVAQTEKDEKKGKSPYYYQKTKISGFRNSHWLNGSAMQDYGSATIMPLFNDLKCQPDNRASEFSHQEETARPDYYAVNLFNGTIKAEMTGTSRTGIFRFTYHQTGTAYIIINPNSDEGEGTITIHPEKGEVTGENPIHRIYQGWGKPAGYSGHFLVQVNKKFSDYGVFQNEKIQKHVTSLSHQPQIGAYIAIPVKAGETITVKMSSSFCDLKGARTNMEKENPGWDFDRIRQQLTQIWEDRLSAIEVTSKDKTDLCKFYTSLYMASFLPHAINDVDGRYPSFAGGKTLHQKDGNYYDDYSLWDTFRALHPLLSILYPQQTGEMIQSLVDKYEDGGWLPIFPCWNSFTSEMIGDHCASLIADAYLKGIRNFDIGKAYEALHKNAFEQPNTYEDYQDGKGRRALWAYQKYGYIPLEDPVSEAYHRGEQTSRTLEYAYDDYCVAKMAEALGHQEDARLLFARSLNYKNVINPKTGWAQGRYRNGNFLNENNAFKNCPFITEGFPCHYTWFVPHDVYGLMQWMGGKDAYIQKLDTMFSQKLYWHGNEPCHQVAFMYNYAGQPWKTQEIVRQIMEREYRLAPDGLSGNDDAGQMSAWYVFAAMGFYPVCPVGGYYNLASPSFKKTTIHLPGDKTFTILAKHASKRNVYIQKATLNGKVYSKNYLNHADIAKGGVLQLIMGDKPNKAWGSLEEDCPPAK